jgi:outer membrane biosynthesis protein TonB
MKLKNNSFKYILVGILTLIFMSSFVAPVSYAKAQETKDDKKEEKQSLRKERNTDSYTVIEQMIEAQRTLNNLVNPQPAPQTQTPAEPEPQNNSIPVLPTLPVSPEPAPVASTTPASETTATTTKPQATSSAPTLEEQTTVRKPKPNPEAEDVLNETLKPEKPIKNNLVPRATSTAAINETGTSTATTTPVGGTTGTIDGGSNSFSPSNYYIPLDNLSPEMTYALSFVALLSGLSGAFMIVREPRLRQKEAWAPRPHLAGEPLLEP